MKLQLVSASLIVCVLAGCESRQGVSDPVKKEDPLAKLDGSKVPPIVGNNGHNLLAAAGALDRAIGLANIVKTVQGKAYCSPERTFYRGRGATDSFWAIECHDHTAFQVMIKKDGEGGVMDCAILEKVDASNGCWQPLPKR